MVHECQHTRRECKDTRHGPGYTRRRYKCHTCKEMFSTIEVSITMVRGKSALETLKEQYGKKVDIADLDRAIELLLKVKEMEQDKAKD